MLNIKETTEAFNDLDDSIGIFELTYEDDFGNMLDEDTITPEWLQENAFWMQAEGESEGDYAMFKKYVALPIDKWKPQDIAFTCEESKLIHTSNRFEWKRRRLLYLKYTEWFDRKTQEMEHLASIALYRKNQTNILEKASKSALTLVEKLQQKIDTIDIDEIKTRDIPGFISALSTFVGLSADAEARALAVDKLLQMYNEEISALDLREHVNYIQASKDELNIESI